MKRYVLITPARNEEAYLEATIQSVIGQSILPLRWVIVSDGSTDRTDEIVAKYAAEHDFIVLLRRTADRQRNFGSKAHAIRMAYEQVQNLEFDFIGNLDADVTFDPTYYEGVLGKFAANERLGVAGGVRFDFCNGRFVKLHCARNSVGGPFQLFRRACYDEIGGYQPLKMGGIDAVAEVMARSKGWEVESFPELVVYHHRCTGTAGRGILAAQYRVGVQEYMLGYHPLFEIVRHVRGLADYPPVIGSLAVLGGYFWASAKKVEKAVPEGFVRYLRAEQMERLRSAGRLPRAVRMERQAGAAERENSGAS